MGKKIIILAGPTASGKSKAAVVIAQAKKNAVIINADSMQVYKEIPVITAQPTKREQGGISHFLYGTVSARENYSTGKWLNAATEKIEECFRQNITPIIVGGTGLYIKALMEGISEIPDINEKVRADVRKKMAELGDEEFRRELEKFDKDSAIKIKKNDKQRLMRAMEVFMETGKPLRHFHENKKGRIDAEFLQYVLLPPRAENRKNIKERLDEMFKAGAVEEIRNLEKMRLSQALPAMKAHGVREIISYIKGEIDERESKEKTLNMISGYIKRQHTWFRNQMPQAKFFSNAQELLSENGARY